MDTSTKNQNDGNVKAAEGSTPTSQSQKANAQDFFCTNKGKTAVSQKKCGLSMRQRQFLLLVDKTDSMSQEICNKLASTIDVEQLLDLGFISTASKLKKARAQLVSNQASEVDVPRANKHAVSAAQVNQPNTVKHAVKLKTPATSALDAAWDLNNAAAMSERGRIKKSLSRVQSPQAPKLNEFNKSYDTVERAKLIMLESLRQTSGLLADGLMRDIESANSITVLKQYSAKWRMTMMEGRVDKHQIDVWYSQVKGIFQNG